MCSLLWGTAFVAQDMGMDYIGPWTFSAARLILGFLALLPFFFIFEFKKVKESKLNIKFVIGYIFFFRVFISWRKHSATNFSNLYRCSKFCGIYSFVCCYSTNNCIFSFFKKNP